MPESADEKFEIYRWEWLTLARTGIEQLARRLRSMPVAPALPFEELVSSEPEAALPVDTIFQIFLEASYHFEISSLSFETKTHAETHIAEVEVLRRKANILPYRLPYSEGLGCFKYFDFATWDHQFAPITFFRREDELTAFLSEMRDYIVESGLALLLPLSEGLWIEIRDHNHAPAANIIYYRIENGIIFPVDVTPSTSS